MGFTESKNTCVNDNLHDHKMRLLALSECTSHLIGNQSDSIFKSGDSEILGFTETEMHELFSDSYVNENLDESALFGMKDQDEDDNCEMYVEQPFNFSMNDTPIQGENNECDSICYDCENNSESRLTEIRDKNGPQCSDTCFSVLSETVDVLSLIHI